jgi:hypothetical protein
MTGSLSNCAGDLEGDVTGTLFCNVVSFSEKPTGHMPVFQDWGPCMTGSLSNCAGDFEGDVTGTLFSNVVSFSEKPTGHMPVFQSD